METTQIAPEKTISEIQNILMNHKADSVLMEFELGKVSSVNFRMTINGQIVSFRLPCRWKSIQELLAVKSLKYKNAWSKEMKDKIRLSFEDQARRVAWRQILRWIEAQFALVETGMVKTEEVFLPYAQSPNGETIFEQMNKIGFNGLLLTNTP